VTQDGTPMQVIASNKTVELPVIDLSQLTEPEKQASVEHHLKQQAVCPFDLSRDLMLRSSLLRLSDSQHILILVMHHIASDGWSMGIFLQELAALYNANVTGVTCSLPELPIQYADYAHWQRQWLQGQQLETQLAYWKQQLQGIPPLLKLPTDRVRPAIQTFTGATESVVLPASLTQALKTLSQQEGVTLFMTLLAAFKTLLHRYTGQSDIVVGSPIAGRHQSQIEGLIGFFVNTLVLRTRFQDNLTFRELLAQVRSVALEAYAHQDLPFEKLVEELQPDRSLSHTPLFQVWFNMLNLGEKQLELSGLTVEQLPISSPVSKFDLTLYVREKQEEIKLEWVYNQDLFNPETIAWMSVHFQTLLEAIVANPGQVIANFPLLSETERQRLHNCKNSVRPNKPFTEFSKAAIEQSISARFEEQVRNYPHNIAIHSKNHLWTYSSLNQKANALAHTLQQRCPDASQRVALLLEHDAPAIAAILGVLKAGKTYVPLDPTYPQSRLTYILEDTQAIAILTNHKNLALARALTSGTLQLINIDEIDLEQTENDANRAIPPDTLAYILYTSGSTGQPKGVIQNHRNVLHFIRNYTNTLHIAADDRLTLLASYSFDAAVIDIFAALLNGATLYPIDIKSEGLTNLADWLRQQEITIYHSTPTVYRHFLETLPLPIKESEAPFPRIRLVVLGGEEVVRNDIELYQKYFSQNCIFVNGLGSTESSFNLHYLIDRQTVIFSPRVPVGYPFEDTEIALLTEAGANAEVYGEIAIRSPYIALGYWQNSQLTQAVFLPDPEAGNRRIYRTGDVGRLRADGTIEFLGRKDFQVKIRGFRIELGEIEANLAQHPAVRETVVMASPDSSGDKSLVAYVVLHHKSTATVLELRRFLKQKLPDYMMPSEWVLLGQLPLTPNGKIDRLALGAISPTRTTAQTFVPPRTPIEEILVNIWTEVLRVEAIGIHENFFELGGHSLKATRVTSRIRQAFGIELAIACLFEYPTIGSLAEHLEPLVHSQPGQKIPPIESAPRSSHLPLSFAQTRLWFLEQLQPNSALYHIPRALQLNGTLNYEALKLALNQIVARHESLRTTFVTQDGTPMQVIASNKTVELPVIDLSQLTEPEKQASVEHHLKQQTVCPFDLSRDLMLRSSLLRLSDSQHILMLVMHHIASDGWSMGIFLQELAALYNANVTGVTCSLPELPIQYADYAHWQRQWLSSQVLDHQLNYWKQQLADAPPLLELPTDRVRPAIQTFNGATKNARLPAALTQALKTLSQQEGVTLFMTLLAAFNILLHRYSGQSDIVVGSPIAGRNQIETEGLIGFFVNTLALRTRFQGNPTFRDVLNQVRSVALGAYAHQDLPFEKLVEQLQTERDLSRTPVFQVMFSLQIAPQGRFELQNIALTPLEIGNFTAKLDLILSLRETETGLQGRWDYNTDLFDGATIERMMGNFETLLEGIVAHPDRNIGELPLLTLRERHQLLVEWNNTSREYPLNKCIHQLFEEQVERTPDRIAAIFKNRKLTYREVNQKSNQLAYCLQEKGVGKGKYVPVLMERSLELLLSYLAIMKTGAAFVPIDPKWPVTRISEILRELNTEVFLINSNQECWEELSKWSCVVVNELELTGSQSNLNVFVNGTDSIYVMFTSGSTGKPKGAINQHRGLTNRFLNANDRYGRKNNDVFLFASNQIFDASIWQLLLPLVNGNCTVIAPPSLGFDLPKIIDLIEKFQVTIAGFVPSIFNLLVERLEQQPKFRQRLQSLRLLIIGGEAINPKAIYRFKSYLPGVEITNGYGPTETSISVIFYDIPSVFTEPIPIGKPLFNVQALILDENLNLVPIGVPGELYIGGVCVGLGYLNNEAATSRAFIPNPFPEIKSDRLYKTGDLVRYLPDGNIEFLGRIDRQVKIRGIRIELGEIEATLAQHPDLREAVVTVREDTPANKRLVAYVVPNASQPTIAQLRSFLKTKLPDYMVPSAFMALERMPLTPNGKINRYALPVPDTSHLSPETDAIAPRNTLELQLAQIWSEVLNIPGVGVRDNFFDLGGHSLLAVRLMACIEQQLGTYLPLATLFTEPTIEHQASLLSAATDAQRSSPLVPIRKTGSLPPLFCVHPIGGDVLCYATLARHLGETQPFWALRSLGLDGECQPLTRIEEMAATYIKALQTIQPSGPYHLAGWSMGGIVAFEMATQLVASGHDVSLLAAIDSDAPLQTFPESLLIDEAMLLVDWVKNLNGLSHKALSVSVEQLRRLAPQEQLPYVVEQAQQVGLLPTEMGHKQGSSLFNVFKANRLSLYSYRPQPYPGRITLFCSTEDSQGERLEPTLGWEELSTSGIDVHAIVSNHFSIVQTRRLAELLSRIIVQL
jgi:amino acid adenylation domain-containing protein